MCPERSDALCPACGSPVSDFRFRIDIWRYVACRSCRLVRMSPLIVPEPMGEDYAGIDLDAYQEFVRRFRKPQHVRAVRMIQKHAPGGTLLDVGCGMGGFLDVAAEAGFRVFGIEPSRIAGGVAAEKHPVLRGDFQHVSLREETFDVVTLWSVLEHVADPGPLLDRVRSVLRNGGLLALRIPVADGLIPRLAFALHRATLGAVDFPLRIIFQLDWHYKHYFLFNLRNARIMLECAGCRVLDRRLEDSCDRASLDLRFAHLDMNPAARFILKTGLDVLLRAASLFEMRDEAVIVARKADHGRL